MSKRKSWRQMVLEIDPKATIKEVRYGSFAYVYSVYDGTGQEIGWTEGNERGTGNAWMRALGTLNQRQHGPRS